MALDRNRGEMKLVLALKVFQHFSKQKKKQNNRKCECVALYECLSMWVYVYRESVSQTKQMNACMHWGRRMVTQHKAAATIRTQQAGLRKRIPEELLRWIFYITSFPDTCTCAGAGETRQTDTKNTATRPRVVTGLKAFLHLVWLSSNIFVFFSRILYMNYMPHLFLFICLFLL